jgi:hypothetical protein
LAGQRHDFSNSAFHVKAFAALNSDHVALACQWGEHDVGSIGFENLPDLVQTTKQDAINFGSRNGYVFNVKSDAIDSLMEFLLGKLDGLGLVASDEDVGGITAGRVRGDVTIHLREWRREVDGGSGG